MSKWVKVTALSWCVLFSLIMLISPGKIAFTLFWIAELIVSILNLFGVLFDEN